MENLAVQQNPLKAFFRKPGIWIKLPSQGKFYKTKPADLNDMGEIPVYPLTAKDELLMKNADALLNGTAVKELIKSCAPSIVEPENMPSVDLDAILVAIRRCTYGEKLSVTVKHDCADAKETDYNVDLNQMIGSIRVIENLPPIELASSIKVFIKPITVKDILALNWVQYEQIRNIQVAEQQNVNEKTKVDLLQQGYQALTNESLRIVGNSIDTVLLPDGVTVTDNKLIAEWVSDLAKPDYSKLEQAIMATNQHGLKKEFTVMCEQCHGHYQSTVDLNPTTFFG
jgi:hypothetical protein